MTYSIAFREEADAELDQAFDWYEQQRIGLGVEFMLAVQSILGSIAENPFLYPVVYKDIRRALVGRFPYAIYYFRAEQRVVVISVFHSSRDPVHWQQRR